MFRYIIRQVLLSLVSFSGIYNYYRKKNCSNVLIMVYHDIVKAIPVKSHYNYNTTIDVVRFRKQVKYIAKYYTPITLDEFVKWKLYNSPLPKNPVLFTFDDGHENLFQNALPILEEFGIKGVFFVKSNSWGKVEQNYCERFLSYTSSYEDGREQYQLFRSAPYKKQLEMLEKRKNDRQHDTLNKEKYSHLTIEQCKELLRLGHSIQSHSVNHYIMSSLDEEDACKEIVVSKNSIESLLCNKVISFAYPFGDPKYDYGERDMKVVKSSGYQLAFSGEYRNINGVTRAENNFSVSRFGDVNHDFLYFKLLLSPVRLVR